MPPVRHSGASTRLFKEFLELPAYTAARFVARRPSPVTPAGQPQTTTNRNGHAGPSIVKLSMSVLDHARRVKRAMSKTIVVVEPSAGGDVTSDSVVDLDAGTVDLGVDTLPPAHENPEIVVSVVSPSSALTAVLRESAAAGSAKKRFVEVWEGSKLVAAVEVTDVHGSFLGDDYFGSSSFSPSESAFVYTAEAKQPDDKEKDVNGNTDPYKKFRYVQSFGEGLGHVKRPMLFVFRWREPEAEAETRAEPSVRAIGLAAPRLEAEGKDGKEGKSKATAPLTPVGQAVFASENVLYATVYEYGADGKLLGLKGCFNHPSVVVRVVLGEDGEQVDGEKGQEEGGEDKTEEAKETKDGKTGEAGSELACTLTRISPSNRSSRSPRVLFAADGTPSLLFWLSNQRGGPHASCASLHVLELRAGAGESRTLVNAVWDPKTGEFPGLYTSYNIPAKPFLRLDIEELPATHIVLQSTWHSRDTVLLVDIQTGVVRDLTPAGEESVVDGGRSFSWGVLGTDGERRVVCVRSSPVSPAEVLLGVVGGKGAVRWRVVERPVLSKEAKDALAGIAYSVVPIPNRYPTETLLLQSKPAVQDEKEKELPWCVTLPHGGPHATITTAFSAVAASMTIDGYTISQPNYTGSLGFGEMYVRKLIGQCGALDVGDCIASVMYLIHQGVSAKGKQLIQGGSHGGFLTAHLIGQFPDVFSAAVMRNPVISAGEISTSDIADWYFEEFGMSYPLETTSLVSASPTPSTSPDPNGSSTSTMHPDAYARLFHASPIAHVHKVRAPLLMVIGQADARVAPTQGIGYYHALKARAAREGQGREGGVEVDLLVFPGESHPIDGIEAGMVAYEAGLDWFRMYTS